MSWKALLSQHLGHTLVVTQMGAANCQTCGDVELNFSPADPHPNVKDPKRCQAHWDSEPCRGCAADRKASA